MVFRLFLIGLSSLCDAVAQPSMMVVAGMFSNPANGSGYVAIANVETVVKNIISEHPDSGGVDTFEYFNAEPGGTANPAQWTTVFASVM